MKRLPITAARNIAEQYDQDQVILVTWDAVDGLMHVVTYGKTIKGCADAAAGGNLVKRALGFPESKCNTKPRRLRQKR